MSTPTSAQTLVLTGAQAVVLRAAAYPHQGMFMDLDTRAVLAPLTKWNAVVHDPRRLPARARAPRLSRSPQRPARAGAPGHSARRARHAGDAVKAAFEQADAIVSIGCRFSSWLWDERGPLARREHALININIDPGALGSPALHQVAMQADALLALEDLLVALPPTLPGADPAWLAGLRALRAAYDVRLAAMARETAATMHPAALAQAVGQALPADALAVFDGGHTTFWSNDLTPVHDVRTRFHDPAMSRLGFGLPYALALQWLHPGRLVVNLTGDGAFGFTLQELDTARRLKLPVINVIDNNASWGIIRQGQRLQFDFESGTSLADTDYAAIARGFGCHGEVITDANEIAAALERARASGLPAVIDCHTRFVPHPAMPAFGSMNRYGFDALTRAGASGV